VNNENPVFRANLDGFAVPEIYTGEHKDNIVVEIKWVSEYGEENWDGDEYCGVPANYYAQVQEYMYVTGARKAIVCALFDSNWRVEFYEVPYNVDFVGKMITETNRFMNVHVNCKIPPKVDCELDKDFVVEALSTPAPPVYDEPDMNDKIALYKDLKKNVKILQNATNKVLSDLTDMYLKGARPTSPLLRMNISTVTSKRFDTVSFEKDHPDLYQQYTKETTYSRTTVK
jgi:predicted phage-related endonuclease